MTTSDSWTDCDRALYAKPGVGAAIGWDLARTRRLCVREVRKVGTVTEFDGLPLLRSPVAIAAFEGWNDAADASTAAVEHLEQVWDAQPITALDPEEFYDFQVNRPTVTMADGETRM